MVHIVPKPITPLLSVDCAAFDRRGRVVLIKRGNPPFQGVHALPGGFVDVDETVEQACRREFREETGLIVNQLHLVGVYSKPDRDPRGHSVSVAFATVIPGAKPKAGDDARSAAWTSRWRTLELAFDHAEILDDAYRCLRHKRRLPPMA